MVRRVLTLMAIVSVLCAGQVQAGIVYSTWVGGAHGSWGSPTNWSPPVVPDNMGADTYVVTINSETMGVSEIEVHLTYSRTVDKLHCYGNVKLGESRDKELTLVDPAGLTNRGELAIDEIEIIGNITNSAGAVLHLLDVHMRGDLSNEAGAILDIREEVSVEAGPANGGNLDNSGTVEINVNGQLHVLELDNLGTIVMQGGGCGAGGAILNRSTGLVRGFGWLHGGERVQNDGQIAAFAGTLIVLTDGALTNTGLWRNEPLASLVIKPSAAPAIRPLAETESAPDVNNMGAIEVNAGGGVALDCNIINLNDLNLPIKLLGGTLAARKITQTAEASLEGFGAVTGDVSVDAGGALKLTGPTNVVGDVEIGESATLQISDGTTLITGRTTCNGTIHLKGGRIIPQGGLSGDCNITWEPGLYSNVADFDLDGDVDFEDFACFADTWLWSNE